MRSSGHALVEALVEDVVDRQLQARNVAHSAAQRVDLRDWHRPPAVAAQAPREGTR